MKREASAVWEGGLKDGHGTLSTQSGTLASTPYSFKDRFESGTATNPEELIAAAHAGCFSMALSGQFAAGVTPRDIRTRATLDFDKTEAGFTVKSIHLQVIARVPGIDAAAFEAAAQRAKETCPISRLLKAQITLEARLEA